MKTLQRMPLWGKILIVFILMTIISSICVSHNIGKLKQDKINLQNTIDKQINQIGVLKDANNNLDSQITESQKEFKF
jgi:cell division protein FtsL